MFLQDLEVRNQRVKVKIQFCFHLRFCQATLVHVCFIDC